MSDVEDYYDEGGLDWLYVEDHYDEADELAEHTCPSPVADAEARADDAGDYDPYDYFEDLEYLSDSYYDDRIPLPKAAEPDQNPSTKRKRQASPLKTHSKSKRQCVSKGHPIPSPPLIRWKEQTLAESRVLEPPVLDPKDSHPVALLKDWKERFQDTPGLLKVVPVKDEEASDDTPSAGIDLNNAQSIASLLTEENMGQLAAALQAKGLDPEAMQVVLEDLSAGREPEFDEGDEDIESTGDHGEEQTLVMSPSQRTTAEAIGSIPHRSLKRKTDDELEQRREVVGDLDVNATAADTEQDGVEPQAQRASAVDTRTVNETTASVFSGSAGADPPLQKPRKRSKRA